MTGAGWASISLGEVLHQRLPDVKVEPTQQYQFAGVYSFARGVFRAPERTGTETSYKVLTRIAAGEFVYPKLMAWEGAFGVVPPECDGCYVSPEFPVFKIERRRVLPRWVEFYFKVPAHWQTISGGSIGTNVRQATPVKRESALPSSTTASLRKLTEELTKSKR